MTNFPGKVKFLVNLQCAEVLIKISLYLFLSIYIYKKKKSLFFFTRIGNSI